MPFSTHNLQSLQQAEKPPTNIIDYVNGFSHWLYYANRMAKVHLESAQNGMKRLCDRQADILFQATFSGPYIVAQKVSDLNYIVDTLDRKKTLCSCVMSTC